MPLIHPFRGLRPAPEYAEAVAAPPYDVLSSAEARERAQGRPWSFLHISKPEIDLPDDVDVYAPQVYAKGAENLRHMVEQGVLQRDSQPVYYAYRLIMDDHQQLGLVAAASVDAYTQGRIRKHEFTRPEKEDDRVRQIDALNAQTGPVFLTYRHQASIDAAMSQATQGEPEYDITAVDGVRHTVWVIQDTALIERLSAGFEALSLVYVADGHHRSAAAARVAQMRGAGAADEAHPAGYFLSVLFPDDQMMILDYNRVVRDLNGLDRDGLLALLHERMQVSAEGQAVRPEHRGEFGMYLPGQWYRLQLREEQIPAAEDPVARLDVSLLAHHIIEPMLGIDDPRRDKRIDFVGGIRGLKELERRVDSGDMAVAFAVRATTLDDLMAVADANEVMPPKSTWFEPKLADGLVSHVLD